MSAPWNTFGIYVLLNAYFADAFHAWKHKLRVGGETGKGACWSAHLICNGYEVDCYVGIDVLE